MSKAIRYEDTPEIRQIIPADRWYAAYWDRDTNQVYTERIACFGLYYDNVHEEDTVSGFLPFQNGGDPGMYFCHTIGDTDYLGMFHEDEKEVRLKEFHEMSMKRWGKKNVKNRL